MNKDRIVGAATAVAGKIKQALGRVTGDRTTVAEGKAQEVAGEVRNAAGGVKDVIRNA